MSENNLLDRKFGYWTVIGGSIEFKNNRGRTERRWLCRCKCGTERYVLERSLLYGGSESCGCEARRRAKEKNSHDLNGKVFDDLTVLCVAEKHPRDKRGGVWWHCRCSCGTELDVLASLLVTGKKTHCGCKSDPQYYFVDIRDKKYGKLTAKYPLKQRDGKGSVIWHCVCDCGNEVDIPYNTLVYSDIQSCGCQKKEHDQLLPTFITRVGGTSIDMIKSTKLPTDNTSGVKGVYFQRGKWFAKIVFQQKQYHLGRYDDIEDAARARKDAEELLFGETAAYYERWKQKADADPAWAEQNPMHITVNKDSAGALQIAFQPNLDG